MTTLIPIVFAHFLLRLLTETVYTGFIIYVSENQRCRSKQIFGGAKKFCPDSPELARKMTSKKKLFMSFFTSIRAPLFSNQSMFGAISSDFQ